MHVMFMLHVTFQIHFMKGHPIRPPTLPTQALFSQGCCETTDAQFWCMPLRRSPGLCEPEFLGRVLMRRLNL